MSRQFTAADIPLLQAHLVALANVELFTIPVYLTAVYSFTDAALNYQDPNNDSTKTPTDVQQKALSVAVQEMYHAQLACNIANAFQVSPQFDTTALSLTAGQGIVVPHLDPDKQKLQLLLGNLATLIPPMIAIETPDPSGFPEPNPEVTYASISDLYHATLTLLAGYLSYAKTSNDPDPHFKSDNLQIAAQTFVQRYTYNTVGSQADVASLADAITDQGEGKIIAGSEAPPQVTANFGAAGENDAGTVDAKYQPVAGSRFSKYDNLTHFARFEAIQNTLNTEMDTWVKAAFGPVFYAGDGNPSDDLPDWAKSKPAEDFQTALNYAWSFLVDSLQATVAPSNGSPSNGSPQDLSSSFYSTMFALKSLIPLVWQTGHCPSYTYQSGVTSDMVQQALSNLDPYCVMHWDQATFDLQNKAASKTTYTAKLPDGRTIEQTYQLNSCEGLNVCATQGWGALATQPGDGACATVDIHTCQGSNSCTHQGGCGFNSASGKETDQWMPGQNSCAGNGGCQTPISPKQYFSNSPAINPAWSQAAKDRLTKLENTPVWDEARSLLAASLNLEQLPTPQSRQEPNSEGVIFDGVARRSVFKPTSPQTGTTSGGGAQCNSGND